MRNFFLCFLISLVLQLPGSYLFGQSAAKNDSLSENLSIRPIDKITDDIRWNAASPDLFTFWIDNGLYGFYGPQPTIFLDGIPVDANFFGWQNINMLPIETDNRVKKGLSHQVFNGTLSPAGYVNFKADSLNDGLSFDASYHVGNETGDPGPYIYDSSRATPNIDRWGPDGEITLNYKTGNWYSKGRFVFRNHLPTDLISNARLHFTASRLGTNQAYVNHRVFANTRSGLLETGFDSERVTLRGRVTMGTSKDYLFLQPLGREVPAQTDYRQIAAEGSYTVNNWKFNGRYVGHQKTIDRRINLHPYIFDWDQRKHTFTAGARFKNSEFYLKPSITYDRLKTFAPGVNKRYSDLLLVALAGHLPISDGSTLAADISVDYDEQRYAKSYRLRLSSMLSDNWEIIPEFQRKQTLPLRQESFSYWVNRGYTFADELNITYAQISSVKMNELTVFKLNNKIKLADNLSILLQQQLINHQQLNIPYQQVESNELTDTEPGQFTITQEQGDRLHLFGKIKNNLSDVFQQTASLNLQRTLSGSSRYKQYFRQIPDTKFQYSIHILPVSSLRLSLHTFYRSSTTWNEFSAIEGNQYRLPGGIPIQDVVGIFDTKTPAYTDISLSTSKWFWDGKLQTSFGINNLLNHELRMHPLGADLNTKFDIKASIQF